MKKRWKTQWFKTGSAREKNALPSMREHTFNGSVQQSCCIFGYGGARLWKTLSCWSNILQYGKWNVLVLYGLWQKVSGFGRIAGTGSCLLEKARVGRILMIVSAAYTAFMLLGSLYAPGPLTTFSLILFLGMTALSYMIMRSWQRKAKETQAEYEELSARVWVDE